MNQPGWQQTWPLSAANQQKRRADDEDVFSAKKFRSAPQSGPLGAQPMQFQQFQQQQPLAPYQQPAAMEMQIEEPPPQPVIQCDTRKCPPCFAHRFCRPGFDCALLPPRACPPANNNSMQI